MTIPPLPTTPVALVVADRSHRAVLTRLGQLYRYDLSAPFQQLPAADGSFENRHLARFFESDTERGWLVHVAGALAGFTTVRPHGDGGHAITQFWVSRALRRGGVGRAAAALLLAELPGRWHIAFQLDNPGAEQFWQRVATDAVGDGWRSHDDPPRDHRRPDRWITFDNA